MPLEFLGNRSERIPLGKPFLWPIRANDEKPSRFCPLRQGREQVKRRHIAPVQILKNENKGNLLGQHLQPFAHLPQHPLLRSTWNFSLHLR